MEVASPGEMHITSDTASSCQLNLKTAVECNQKKRMTMRIMMKMMKRRMLARMRKVTMHERFPLSEVM